MMTMNEEHTPLIRALLACEIAGVAMDAGMVNDSELTHEDFSLQGELSEGVSLCIAHDADERSFTVGSAVTPSPADLHHIALLALSLNLPAPASDRFALDLESSSVMFARTLSEEGLELAELAVALRTAAEVGMSLQAGELPEILAENEQPAAEFGVDAGGTRL